MARAARGDQRTLLHSHETPSADFVNQFKASHKLSSALAADRKTGANGQAALLQKKAQQGAYVEEARKRVKPPHPHVVEQQGHLSELRMDAPMNMKPAYENPDQKQARASKREAFLESRKQRHNDADDLYEKEIDVLAERCKSEAQDAAKRMKRDVEVADGEIEKLLYPLEVDVDHLGEKTEHEVQEVMRHLDGVITQRRDRIEEFSAELERMEHRRREDAVALLKALVETSTAAAHVVPGELERVVETKTLAVNEALLENKKACKKLTAMLTVQTLEKSKENKVRWHRGNMLWKQLRHRHSVEQVVARLEGMEFRQPDSLVALLGRFREGQVQVYESRKELLDQCFSTPYKSLTQRLVRSWEEQNTSVNDNAQEGFDALLAEMKEAKDLLDIKAENMLSVLMQELETIDARQEWGEHESVNDLVNADVRPHLQECLTIVANLLMEVNEAFNHQEEVQHANCVKVVAWFLSLAKKQEQLRKGIQDVEICYMSDIDVAVDNFDADSGKNEKNMNNLLNIEISDSVHHEELDELKVKAFELLDVMALLYRSHAEETTNIHEGYPQRVADFYQPEVEGLCSDLGLITEDKVEDDRATAEENGDPEPYNPPPGEPIEFQAWTQGADCKVVVYDFLPISQVREKILTAAPPAADVPAGDDDKTLLPGDPAAAVTTDEGNPPGHADATEIPVPKFFDGSLALAALEIEGDWLDERLEEERRLVFAHLAVERDKLDEVDIQDAVEKIRVQLDHRLRKHTNRKGEVQVEHYLPRYTTISKHKDKFERHIIDIARKSQEHDEVADKFFNEVDALEQGYKDELVELTTKFPAAEALPMLTKVQREALDKSAKLKEACQAIRTKLMDLATRKPDGLKRENTAFIDLCRSGEEKYGPKELTFYTTELNELNSQLVERGRDRSERSQELDGRLDSMRKVPYQEFNEKYLEAEENLCASKGLGRKHGEPRRAAQERCRTLNTWGADARNQVDSLCKYFSELSEQMIDDVDVAELPEYKVFNLRNMFKRKESPWVFTAEILGSFSVLVCALDSLGVHLSALKEEHVPKYTVANIKLVRLLAEGEPKPADGDDAAKSAELDLRQDCLSRVMGPLLGSNPYNDVIKSAVDSSHQTYASKGGTPQFMQTFLDDMTESSERSRLEKAIGIRDICDELRESILMKLGDAMFNELTNRYVLELRRRSRDVQNQTTAVWAESDAERAANESALNPKLANPNNEKDLISLVEREAERYDNALTTVAEDKVRMVNRLRETADEFLRCMSARFEVALTLIDALPLHSHFAPLPGDEQVEAPRMSIKRRMRRMNAGQPCDDGGDGLPERTWTGLPRYELRSMLMDGTWPADPELADLAPEALASERTASVPSFRSPVHRQVYDRRKVYYEKFRDEFEAEVKRRSIQLEAREEKEKVGDKTFSISARQLGEEVVSKVLEERRQRIQAAKDAADAAAAAEKAALEPPGKGKKK